MGHLTYDELAGLGVWGKFRRWQEGQRRYGSAPASWQFWRGPSPGEVRARIERERLLTLRRAREARSAGAARRAHQRELAKYRQQDRASGWRSRRDRPKTVTERRWAAGFRRQHGRLPYRSEYPTAERPHGRLALSSADVRRGALKRSRARKREQERKRELARAAAAMLAPRARIEAEARYRKALAASKYSRPVKGSTMAMRTRPPVPTKPVFPTAPRGGLVTAFGPVATSAPMTYAQARF
jgi:hypothetical protein